LRRCAVTAAGWLAHLLRRVDPLEPIAIALGQRVIVMVVVGEDVVVDTRLQRKVRALGRVRVRAGDAAQPLLLVDVAYDVELALARQLQIERLVQAPDVMRVLPLLQVCLLRWVPELLQHGVDLVIALITGVCVGRLVVR
jgi:hypothetical protein